MPTEIRVWLLDYNEESGELEFHYCHKSEWNSVRVTKSEADRMHEEFTAAGKTTWIGKSDTIVFVRGPGPMDLD